MIKEIMLNGMRVNINKITLDDIVLFIEKEHPKDKKKFAELVFNKAKKEYNHFRARKVFLSLYFPETLERQEKTVSPSEKIRGWLEENDEEDTE